MSEQKRPLRLFIVEDHADTLAALAFTATQMGCEVASAKNMQEALTGLATSDCDVLLSDIGLPDGDGWELLKKVHFSHPVYAIAMSGFGTEADIARSRDAGFAFHITKPFKFAELKRALRLAAANVETE